MPEDPRWILGAHASSHRPAGCGAARTADRLRRAQRVRPRGGVPATGLADAAPLRRRPARLVRLAAAAARPGPPARPEDRHRLPWLPASRPGRQPALVAVEGGPGYPSTGSLFEYHGMYGPLLHDHNLLLVDNRGTGSSALIDCPAVQDFPGETSGRAFPRRVAACAHAHRAALAGRARRRPVRTAYAAEDLAAVLRALRLGRVDLYGDSYGTWFDQSFMARHPRRCARWSLDSAYPVRRARPLVRVLGGGRAACARRRLRRVAGLPARAARPTGSRSCWHGCAQAPISGQDARLGRQPADVAVTVADDRRPRAGRRLGPGDLPRARPVGGARRWRAIRCRCCGSRSSRAPTTTARARRTTSRTASTSR